MDYIQQANKAYIQIAISLNLAPVAKVLAGTNLTQQILSEIESIDMADSIKMVKNMNRYSSNPNWAAVLGNHLGIATHGPVGFAAISAPTVGKAISTFIDWFQLRSTCYTSKIKELNDKFEIYIQDTTGDPSFKSFFFEAYMRAFEVLITLLVGQPPVGKTDIFFESIPEQRQASICKEYDSSLHFNAQANKFVIPKAIWFLASPLSEPDSHMLNIQKCKQLMAQLDFGDRVDLVIKNTLRQHFENKLLQTNDDEPIPSFKKMSTLTHQTERTLTRKLNKLGVSYKEILKDERKHFVQILLKDARYTIIDISYLLGYNEPASFCRAFKGWFLMKPSEFRRNPTL